MKIRLLLILALSVPVHAANIAQIQLYADNAILDAATHGRKNVTLRFGRLDQASIEELSDSLRDRGYRVDEEATLLNPAIIRIEGLHATAMVKAAL